MEHLDFNRYSLAHFTLFLKAEQLKSKYSWEVQLEAEQSDYLENWRHDIQHNYTLPNDVEQNDAQKNIA